MPQLISVLDEVGDKDAPKGSRSWAVWFVNRARIRRDNLENDAKSLRELIEKLKAGEAWKPLGFASFDMLAASKLNLSPDELDAITKAPKGRTIGDVLALKPLGVNQHSEGYSIKENRIPVRGGTNSAYRIAKLKRDAPEFAERLQAGEFSTVREAERAAGVDVPAMLTRLEKVQRAYSRLSDDDKAAFKEWLFS